jgi:hypothetical protein
MKFGFCIPDLPELLFRHFPLAMVAFSPHVCSCELLWVPSVSAAARWRKLTASLYGLLSEKGSGSDRYSIRHVV